MSIELSTSYRSTLAGALRGSDIGTEVTLVGWVHRRRDLGGLVFVDLRDRAGLLQVSFDPAWTPAGAMQAARSLGPEDVVQVRGRVERRPGNNPNLELATGEVEVRGVELTILAQAEPLPIPVYRTPEEELPSEDLRLRYRYLDLRRLELQRNLLMRHRAARSVRGFLDALGFVEVETPMLTRRTPEGARDYLVPSRVHPGEFFALPQSPQLYKQLLMVSGFDRYYQIVRCLRDEDLRADRQPEFTQIDAEMAFVSEEDVFAVGEGMIAALWRDVLGVELPQPFPRLTYHESLSRYGTDKPDLRYELAIVDLTEAFRGSEFRIFQAAAEAGQAIRGFRVPGGAELSRRELDELQEVARRAGAAGALFAKWSADGAAGPLSKALEGAFLDRFLSISGTQAGDLFVAVVGHARVHHADVDVVPGARLAGAGEAAIESALDELRRHLARRMGLMDPARHAWAWITEFPLLDWDPESGRLIAGHHPFTAPLAGDVERLRALLGTGAVTAETARELYGAGLRSRAYDAVYNGFEMASGSVRIHDPELQALIFRTLGMSDEEARAKFGFLLEAFRFGAPPHAGFAFGFDRLVMLLAGAPSLREVIAFPKTTAARALFEGAPSPVPSEELRELHVRVTAPEGPAKE